MKKFFLIFLFTVSIISKLVVLPGCANIIPPSGGPRDSLPPVLVKAVPADSSRNFTGNHITFTFDEFIDMQNVRENLIISPLPKSDPAVDFKLKTITVRLKDTLQPNTTYTLNFGNAIKDYNEGNVLKNFRYIFSTGNTIDTFELQGKVILAENGKTDSTLMIMLHTSGKDSAVIKEKPRYICRTDNQGNFVFHNLPKGTFYLYAVKDDGSLRYQNPRQLFAFADKAVVTGAETKPITLYAYAEQQAQLPIQQLGLGGRRTQAGAADRRLRFQSSVVGGQQDLLDDFTLTFEQPLRSLDSSKILLRTDSSFQSVPNYKLEKDSTSKKIKLITSWQENTVYHLILDKDFAEDTTGKKLLKTDTISFTTRKKDEYGSLSIRFRNLDLTTNPVLLFVQNEQIKKSYPLTSADFRQALFLPGDYELRILMDSNKNGKWDPGEFLGKHRQPEIVKPVTSKSTITVKANWENEFEIAL
jgi:hypothetical protein